MNQNNISTNINPDNKEKDDVSYFDIILGLENCDLDKKVVNRNLFIFSYFRNIFEQYLKKGIENIYFGSKKKVIKKNDDNGNLYNLTIRDEIVSNKALVQQHLSNPSNNLNLSNLVRLFKFKINCITSTILNTKLFKNTLLINGKLEKKFERYYTMYEIPIVKRLQKDLFNHIGELTNEDVKFYISNILEEVSYLIYAFGETLGVSTLDMIIVGQDEKTKGNHESIMGFTKDIVRRYDSLKNYPKLLEMYKHFVKDGIDFHENGRVNFSNSKLKGDNSENIGIEGHFGESLSSLADIYKQWFYSEKPNIVDLKNIHFRIKELVDFIVVLKVQKIAFGDIIIEKLYEKILQKYNKNLTLVLTKDFELEKFKNLFESKIYHNNDEYYECFSNEVFCNRSNDLKNIGFIDIQNIKLSNLNFSDYAKASPNDRKKYFLNNVFGINKIDEKIDLRNLPDRTGDNLHIYQRFLEFYCYRFGKKLKHGITEQKIEYIFNSFYKKVNKGITIEKLEVNNIEFEQIAIAWFRFYLIYKENEGKPSLKDKIKREIDNMHGTREYILSMFEKEDVIGNIQFVSGNIHNSSELGIPEMLKIHDTRFTNRFVKLDDEKNFGYKNTKCSKILFKKKKDFYLPKNTNLSEEYIEIYLKGFLDTCNSILQRKKSSEFSYFENIIKDNMGEDFDLDDISNLRVFLKYCLYVLPIISEMHKKAEIERNFLIENKNKFGIDIKIGPDKTLERVMEKVINSYNGDIRELGDLSRARNVSKNFGGSIDNLIIFLKTIKENKGLNDQIVQVIIEDNTGNPSERGKKATGYRDINLRLKTIDGNVIEVQFLTEEIYNFKEKGIPEFDLISLFKENGISLSEKDLDLIYEISESKGLDIVENFSLLKDNISIFKNLKGHFVTNKGKKLNSDWFYDLWRGSGNQEFEEKIQRMESLPNIKSWGKVIFDQTKEILS